MSSDNGFENRKRPHSAITPTPGIQDNNEDVVDHRIDYFPGAPNLYTTSFATNQSQGLAGGYSGQQHLPGNHYTPQVSGPPNDSPAGRGSNYPFNFNAPQGFPQWPSAAAGYHQPHSLQPVNPYMVPNDAFRASGESGHVFAYDGYQPSQSSAFNRHGDALGNEIIQKLKASPFWHQHNRFLVRYNHKIIDGTPAALWDQGFNVQCAIIEKFVNSLGIAALFSTPPDSTSPHGAQGLIDNGDEEDDDVSDTPSKKPKISPKSTKKPTQKKTPKNNSSKTPRKRSAAKKFPDAPCADFNTVAAYAPDSDLATTADCWNFLLYPADVDPIKPIPGDDWQDVRDNRQQEFIAKIYNALLHPHKADPGSYDFMEGKTLNMKTYNDGQAKALRQCGEALGIPERAKETRVWCRLLVERVIFFHEHGVIKRKSDGHHWHVENDKSMDRKFEIDFATICSARLEKIVEAVKYHKNIAHDVATGENRDRIAEHPDFYLEKKFSMAESNYKRQAKVDKANQLQEEMREKATENVQKKAKPRASRAKPKGKAPVAEESDEEEAATMRPAVLASLNSLKSRAGRGLKVQRKVEEYDDGDEDEDDGFADEVSQEEYDDQFEKNSENEDEEGESDEEFEPSP